MTSSHLCGKVQEWLKPERFRVEAEFLWCRQTVWSSWPEGAVGVVWVGGAHGWMGTSRFICTQ